MDETFSLFVHETHKADLNLGGIGAALDENEWLRTAAYHRHLNRTGPLMICQKRDREPSNRLNKFLLSPTPTMRRFGAFGGAELASKIVARNKVNLGTC